MMQLNNKGFAITGILYTLFILFLLILVSVLSGLSSKKNMLEKLTMSYEDDYSGRKLNATEEEYKEIVDAIESNSTTVLAKEGKYVFSVTDNTEKESKKYQCVTYLKNGDSLILDNMTFVTDLCNKNGYDISFSLKEVYLFDR